jgi:hypothetical protein
MLVKISIFSSLNNTQNIYGSIRMTVTCVHGTMVVRPDWFVEIALGSSLIPVKARFILSLSLNQNDLL